MARPISAGDLTDIITFQVRAPGVDTHGRPNGAWADVPDDAAVWAKPAFITGADIAAAGQLQATLDAQFIVRYRTDIQPTWRVMWMGRPFEIVGQPAPVEGGREWLLVRCTQGVRAGR